MSKLAELGTLSCEQSAEETIWRIDWHESVSATLSFVAVPQLRPMRGLLYSLGLHVCVVFAAGYFQWWSFLLPAPRYFTQQEEARIEYEPIFFRQLPALGAQSGSDAGGAGSSASSKNNHPAPAEKNPAEKAPREEALPKTKAVYAGRQEIISNPPDAINVVQTVRRPDLVTPPKLKFPIRVQSMVMLPQAAVVPTLRVPAPKRPASAAVVEVKSKPVLEKPLLPIPSTQPATLVAQQLASVASPAPQLAPSPAKSKQLSASPLDSNSDNEKAAIVVNAVTVPPDAPATIPNGEISGSFAVIASVPARVADGSALPQAGGSGIGSEKGSEKSSQKLGDSAGLGASSSGDNTGSGGEKEGRGAGTIADGKGAGGNLSSTGLGGRGLSGSGTTRGASSGKSDFPGITIIGASRGPALPMVTPVPRRRPGYGITIISGGTSSGASSDLGVFNRSDTVYTVYIPMSDIFGGADWSMQYALTGSLPPGNGLLSPPLATKKVAAISAVDPPLPRGGRVFIAAIISETGDLRDVHAVRPEESGSQIAMDALRQWQFEPAEINGKPVATKVLIGVAITNPVPTGLGR